MKPMKMPKGMSDKPMPQHHKLALGMPVNKMTFKGPKTPA